MNPKLSIIVPVYNNEKYVEKCVESLIHQTYPNVEILLVDDGSADASLKICNEYARKYDYIKVICEGHGGPTHARKAGFRNSCGAYISFVDGDDYIEPETYTYLIEKMQEYRADIAVCNIAKVFDKTEVFLRKNLPEGLYDKPRLEKEIYPYMLYSPELNVPLISPSLCNKVFRRELLEPTLLAADESVLYGEDAACAYPCMLDAERVYITKDKYFYKYVQTNDSASKKYESDLLNKLLPFVLALDKAFESRNYRDKAVLNSYAAVQIVHGIRGELLCKGALSLPKRIQRVKREIDNPRWVEVFESVQKSDLDKSLKFKMYLAGKKRLFLLYLLFSAKETVLQIKGLVR